MNFLTSLIAGVIAKMAAFVAIFRWANDIRDKNDEKEKSKALENKIDTVKNISDLSPLDRRIMLDKWRRRK